MSETAIRNLPASAWSKKAVSEHAQEHAAGFSPAVLDKWGRSMAFRIPGDVVRDYKIVPGKKCLILNENGVLKVIVK